MARPWWEMEAGEKVGVGSRSTGEAGRATVGGAVQARARAQGWTPGMRPWWEDARQGRAGMTGGGQGWAPYLPVVTRGVEDTGWEPPVYTEFERAGQGLAGRVAGMEGGVQGAAPVQAGAGVEGWTAGVREGMPGWFGRVADWASAIISPTEERLAEAWRAPYERMGAEAGEELLAPMEVFEARREQALAEGMSEEEAYKEAGRAQLAALQRGMTLADYKRAFGELEKKENLAGQVARRIGQVGGVGLEGLFVEPAMMAKQVPAAAVLEAGYGVGDLPVEKVAPVARVMGSLEFADIERRWREKGWASLWEKPEDFEEAMREGSPTVREALERIRAGEDAEAVAAEYENPVVEMAVEALTDPLNLIDVGGWGAEGIRAGQLSDAEKVVARLVDEVPEARRAVEETARAMRESGELAEGALRAGVDSRQVRAGMTEGEARGFVERVGDILRKPVELVPEAKAERDMGEVWIVLGGPMSEARSGDEAIGLMRQWAEDPGALAGRYGATVDSQAGRKAQAIFSEIWEDAAKLPEARKGAGEFNPAQFVVELEELALGRLREGYGWKEPGAYLRFANAWKGLQSEFYLTAAFSPGYVMRNTASDLFTSAVDGLATFEHADDIERYLGELGAVTTRRATTGGKGAREALTGMAEGKSKLPGLLGKISEKGQEVTRYGEPLGRIPLGEEPRYRRALYMGVKRFLDSNAVTRTPELPARVRVALGPQADDLVEAVARGMGPEAKKAAVERVLGARGPAEALEPSRYLDLETLDAMSPEMYGRLTERLRGLGPDATVDDVGRLFDEARGWVDEFEGKALADEVGQGGGIVPGRKVASDVEEGELAEAVLIELRGALERAGVPADEVERLVGDVQGRMEALQGMLDEARAEAVRDAADSVEMGLVDGRDALEVMLAANRDVDRMRDGVRRTVDGLMKDAVDAYRADPGRGEEIWIPYVQEVAAAWDGAALERAERFVEAQRQLGQLSEGMRVEDVLGMGRRELAEARLRGVVDEVVERPLVGAEEYVPGGVLDEAETELFNQYLKARRSEVDVAQGKAWRRGFGAPGERYGDVLDLLDSAGRDVEFYGRRAAAEKEIAKQAFLDEVASLKARKPKRWKAKIKAAQTEYIKERNRIWDAAFRQQVDRWVQAEVDVGRVETRLGSSQGRRTAGRVEGAAARTAPGQRVARTTPEGMRSGVMNPEGTASVRYRGPAQEGGRWEVDYIGADGKVIETRTAENEGEARRLAEMGEREASLRARAVRSGEGTVQGTHSVPEGTAAVSVRKEGANWQVDYVDPTGRVLASYDYGPYGSAKAAKGRAERILEARARGMDARQGRAGMTGEVAGGRLRTREDWARDLVDVWGVDEEKARDWLAVMDARAKVWSRQSGRPAGEYWGAYYERLVRGGEAGAGALMQLEGVAGVNTRYLDELRRRLGSGGSEPVNGFLLPDGKYVQTWGHNDVAHGISGDPSVVNFIGETGAVRVNRVTGAGGGDRFSLTIGRELTQDQRRAISRLLRQSDQPLDIAVWVRGSRVPEWHKVENGVDLRRFFNGGRDVLYQEGPGVGSEAFRRWFGESKAVDEAGDAKVLYHGTTRTFGEFDPGLADPEAWWGGGIYLTDEVDDVSVNYAGMGPDLTNKVERFAERIPEDFVFDPEPYLDDLAEIRGVGRAELEALDDAGALELTDDEVMALAQRMQGIEHGGQVLPVYVKLENPVVVDAYGGGTRLGLETRADVEELAGEIASRWDELDEWELADVLAEIRDVDTDEVAELIEAGDLEISKAEARRLAEERPGLGWDLGIEEQAVLVDETGREMDLAAAFDEAARMRGVDDVYEWPDGAQIYQEFLEETGGEFYGTAEQFRETVANLPSVQYMEGEWRGENKLLNHQFVRELMEALGYDGVIMDAGRAFPRMEGTAGATHYIVFEPTQVKSAIANVGAYDPGDPRLMMQRGKAAVEFGEEGRAILRAFEQADVSSLVHEVGHVWLRELGDLAKVDAGVAEDLRVLEDWAGVVEGRWTREAEEQWARGVERYFAEGVAPVEELRGVFERFRDWLVEIYRAIVGSDIDVELTDEVRGVMDRLLDEGGGAQHAAPVQAAGEGVRRPAGVGADEWDWMQRQRRAELAAARSRRIPGDVMEAAEQMGQGFVEGGRGVEGFTEEDWMRLAVELRGEAGYAVERSTPEGLNYLADQAAHKGGGTEYMEIGGYTKEVRKRALTRRQEREYRRGIMGVFADDPKGYYARQRALADWYYDLADDAEVMAGGGRVEPRVMPEELLVTSSGVEDLERRLEQGMGALEEARARVAEAEGNVGAGPGQVSRTEATRRRRAATKAEKELEELVQRARGEAAGDDPFVQEAISRAAEMVEGGGAQHAAPVQEAGRAAYNAGVVERGAGEAPGRGELVQVTAEATRRGLDQMEEGLAGDWERWRPVVEDAAMRRGVERWLDEQVMPAWFETRATALAYGKNAADFALLNYRNRRNFDVWLSYVAPYSYWYTRSGANWAKRLAGRPGMLSQYLRARRAMKLANENAGRRSRFERKVRVPFPWLPDWMGDALYVDPLRFIVPFAAYERTDWDDPEESRKGLRAVFGGLEKVGLRPYHFLELPYKAGWLQRAGEAMGLGEEEAREYLGPGMEGDFGFFLPQTRAIRSATALGREVAPGAFGWVPPGGVNVEAPLRGLLGLPAGEVWDPYRVGRTLANMAGERPGDLEFTRAALMGQELLRRDESQTGKVWEPGSGLAEQVAAEQGWTGEELAAAQALLVEALQRTAMEQGVGSAGWALGPGLSVEPAGERARLGLAETARGMGWSPMDSRQGRAGMTGSRAAYEQYREETPALEVHGAQYGLVPGEEEGYTPGMRLQNLDVGRRRDEVNAEFDRRVDELLRVRPWDEDGRKALEEERRAALEAAGSFATNGTNFPNVEGALPEMRYGENPVEYGERVALDVARSVRDSAPEPESYTDSSGEVNWSGYFAEYDRWLEGLPESRPELDAVRALGGRYAGMGVRELVEAYGRQWDSPLEAVAKVYREAVVDRAWDEYKAEKAAEEERWPGMAALEDRYFELDQAGRRALLRENPGLGDYWDYKKGRGSVYDRTVGAIGPMEARELIPAVLKVYGERGWTAEQLAGEYAGVRFPGYSEQQGEMDSRQGRAGMTEGAGAGALGGAARASSGGGGGGAQHAAPVQGEWSWMWPGGEGYEEAAARVASEGWREVYGKPWWERYPRRSWGGGGGGGGYSRARWIPAGQSYWDRWRPPSRIYGGPFRS